MKVQSTFGTGMNKSVVSVGFYKGWLYGVLASVRRTACSLVSGLLGHALLTHEMF